MSNNQPSKSENDDFQGKIELLLTIVGILLIVVLVFIYPSLSGKQNFVDSLRQLAQNIIPGIVGAIISYFTLYFVLFKKKISLKTTPPSQEIGNYEQLIQNIDQLTQELKGEEYKIGKLKEVVVVEEEKIDQLTKEVQREEEKEKENFKAVREKIEETKNKIIEEIDKTKKVVSEDTIEINSLYTLYGLKNQERTGVETFQDFNVDRLRGNNKNAVSYLWADTYRGNEINAFIIKREGEIPFLRIKFNSKENSLGCNLAIRPQDEQPLDNRPPNKKKYLVFQAKIHQENETQENENFKDIALAFRIVNGYMQHWEYAGRNKEYRQIHVNSNKWKTFYLDLGDSNKWSLFDADGNQIKGPKDANFDVIASVVIKVGSYTGAAEEPGAGEGIIDIRELKLSLTEPYRD